MATRPIHNKAVSVEEYLSMALEHDCEYVDGVIEKRDLGGFEHAYVPPTFSPGWIRSWPDTAS